MESGPQRIIGVVATQGLVEIGSPFFDYFAGGAFGFADVVAVAHEGVDGAHGVLLFSGEQQERVIEVAGACAGDAAAEGVGVRFRYRHACATAPSSSWMRSNFEMVGRWDSTL